MTKLERTLIDNAKTHQEALAAYYPKYQAKQSSSDEHAEYLNHSHALTELVSLAQHDSGLSPEAAEQLWMIEDEDAATFRQHFPVDAATAEKIVSQASTHIFLKDGQ